jgi:anti-sigma factor RsiW
MSHVSRIDCTAAVRRLWDAVDGALTAERLAEVEAHLAECERCPPHFEFARSMRGHIAAARLEHPDLEPLRTRLEAALRAEGYASGRGEDGQG